MPCENAAIGVITPTILFDLDTGGGFRNEESSKYISVSVPASPSEFSDGAPTSGMVLVCITALAMWQMEARRNIY